MQSGIPVSTCQRTKTMGDHGSQPLASGKYEDEGGFMDSAAIMVLERMRKGAAAGTPVICSVWAWARQKVMGHIVQIRHLRATAGKSRNNTRLKLESPPLSSCPFLNSTTSVLFPEVASSCLSPCLLPLTWRPAAVSWTPPPPASSALDHAP